MYQGVGEFLTFRSFMIRCMMVMYLESKQRELFGLIDGTSGNSEEKKEFDFFERHKNAFLSEMQ